MHGIWRKQECASPFLKHQTRCYDLSFKLFGGFLTFFLSVFCVQLMRWTSSILYTQAPFQLTCSPFFFLGYACSFGGRINNARIRFSTEARSQTMTNARRENESIWNQKIITRKKTITSTTAQQKSSPQRATSEWHFCYLLQHVTHANEYKEHFILLFIFFSFFAFTLFQSLYSLCFAYI